MIEDKNTKKLQRKKNVMVVLIKAGETGAHVNRKDDKNKRRKEGQKERRKEGRKEGRKERMPERT